MMAVAPIQVDTKVEDLCTTLADICRTSRNKFEWLLNKVFG